MALTCCQESSLFWTTFQSPDYTDIKLELACIESSVPFERINQNKNLTLHNTIDK